MTTTTLCPAQRTAFEALTRVVSAKRPLACLSVQWSFGRTTILRELQRECGGSIVSSIDLVQEMQSRHPLALEEAFHTIVGTALDRHDLVLVDDVHLLLAVVDDDCRSYPRSNWLDAAIKALAARAAAETKTLLLSGSPLVMVPHVIRRGVVVEVEDFEVDDYRHFFASTESERIDVARLFRFAPQLDCRLLVHLAQWLTSNADADTDALLGYAKDRFLNSNVEIEEVAQVELTDLVGVDDVLEQLEAHVILPFEDDALTSELGLVPKRGVLLSGPPGTGKTSIGRALAHRLGGKFFLLDGTAISGTQHFYGQVHRVFEDAKANAPSVLFIDDSDVIFESGEEHGLYRYLLTMLDGLESKSNARVCVMMTAMEVGNLPPALIRSGRVELWLQMRMPDLEARTALIARAIAKMAAPFREIDVARLAAAAQHFTGADLKRVLEDGKLLYAHDRVRRRELMPVTDYFLAAVETVAANRTRYVEASDALKSRTARPTWFSVGYPGGEAASAGGAQS